MRVTLDMSLTRLQSATGATTMRAVLDAAAASGMLEQYAKESPAGAVIFRDAMYRAAETAFTEETTDAALDALEGLRFKLGPVPIPMGIVRAVLDTLLPQGLLKLMRWVIYRPTHKSV